MPTQSKPKAQEGSSKGLIIAVCMAALLVIILLARRESKPETASEGDKSANAAAAVAERDSRRPPAPATETEPTEEAPEPEKNGESAWLVDDFRLPNRSWEGYKLTGLKVTDQGLTLADGADKGVLETPPTVLKLPSSTVAPLWKKEGPDGSFNVEVRISSDGQSWSPWYPIADTGDDINPIYPDGTPNPNYGYVPGAPLNLGLVLVSFVQKRITLTKTGQTIEMPVLMGTRTYHGDFTLGEGVQATE